MDSLKRDDQIKLLETVREFTDTGKWDGIFTYPNCGQDLVKMGLVTEDKKITIAGRSVLWLIGKGIDPTDSTSYESFNFLLQGGKDNES